MGDLAVAVIVALVAFRVWYFVARDYISEGPRDWVLDRTPEWVSVFVNCPWCLGFWIAGALTFGVNTIFYQFSMPWWFMWPAVSAIVGLLSLRSEQ